MRIRLTLFPAVLFLVVTGCQNAPIVSGETNQGKVTYRVTYPDSASYGMKAVFFPREIHLIYRGSKATFIASGGMGMIQVVNILDASNRHAVSLLIDQLRENFGCTLTHQEIRTNETGGPCTVEYTGDTATVGGRPARQIQVRNAGGQALFTGYCDATIPFAYWNSPFAGINRLLLEYDHTVNGLTMHLSAASVDIVTPVDTGMFEIKGEYKWVSQKELFARLAAL